MGIVGTVLILTLIPTVFCYLLDSDFFNTSSTLGKIVEVALYVFAVLLFFVLVLGTQEQEINTFLGEFRVPSFLLGALAVLSQFSIVLYLLPLSALLYIVKRVKDAANKKQSRAYDGKSVSEKCKGNKEDNIKTLKKFVCTECGAYSTGWYQKCPSCGAVGKMKKNDM